MTFTPEILVPCSETLDGFGSGALGKYPHRYLVRDTITLGAILDGSADSVQRLVKDFKSCPRLRTKKII